MKDVIKFLDNYLTENDIVVCATSGGVDSMSLLSMLKNYNKDFAEKVKHRDLPCAALRVWLRFSQKFALCLIFGSSPTNLRFSSESPFTNKKRHPNGCLFLLVESGGLEPSTFRV